MLAKVFSVAHFGLDTVKIEVEVDVAGRGFPGLHLVGLPSKAVEEAKERVRSAIVNSGIDFPSRSRIVVNLAPADLVKEGSCYDLPIALAILLASGMVSFDRKIFNESFFYGELSLDGSLRHSKGVFLLADFARREKIANIFIPKLSANEAACVTGAKIFPVESLPSLLNHFAGVKKILPLEKISISKLLTETEAEFDMADIIGQYQAKRALEIAAAGNHNVFMKGPPGSGKTMLSRAMVGIMPPLTEEESMEVTKIYSVSGNIKIGDFIVRSRPFRAPHHTISRVGLIGGGANLSPGEVSMAHRGILFLDELPEFPRNVLEAIRQPLEDRRVVISRAAGTVSFPCYFLMIAASNPCPCGFLAHPKKPCRCSQIEISRYQKRISGPILDRIDIHLNVPPVDPEKLGKYKNVLEEKSIVIRERVIRARNRQLVRFKALKLPFVSNSEMGPRDIKKVCRISEDGQRLLLQAAQSFNLSARGYFKTIKIAQTIADLTGEDEIASEFIAEALQYLPKTED